MRPRDCPGRDLMALYPVVHRVDGLRELEANLKVLREEFGVKTGGVIIRGLRAGAKLIKNDAKRRVTSVPSGFGPKFITRGRGKSKRQVASTGLNIAAMLRSNIVEHAIPSNSRLAGGKPTVLVRVRNQGYTRIGGKIRFNRPGSAPGWWWWLEFGTSRSAARPFLRPAFETQKVAAVDAMKSHIRGEIAKAFSQRGRTARFAA